MTMKGCVVMADIKCKNCGKTIQHWYRTCPFCHIKLSTENENTSHFACPYCKKFVNAANTICPHCNRYMGYDLLVVGVDEDEFNGNSSEDYVPQEDESTSSPKQLWMDNQIDELVKRTRRIDENLIVIRQYLKFFVILAAIALIIYLISLCVSCHAGCKAAEEFNNYYSFLPYI